MSKAAAILLISLSMVQASNASASCTIAVKLKKVGQKSGYTLSGERMSFSTLEKTGCKIQKTLMSVSELRAQDIKDQRLKIEKAQAKLAKLGVK